MKDTPRTNQLGTDGLTMSQHALTCYNLYLHSFGFARSSAVGSAKLVIAVVATRLALALLLASTAASAPKLLHISHFWKMDLMRRGAPVVFLLCTWRVSTAQTPGPTVPTCPDAAPFNGVLKPCTGTGCTVSTETCAQLGALGGCIKPFGDIFEFADGPPLSVGQIVDNRTWIASVCRATCNVCHMSNQDVQSNIALFTAFDSNHDGTIEGDELKALLHVSGVDITDAQLQIVLAKDDTNHDGKISFAEFVTETAKTPGAATAAANGGATTNTCTETAVTVGTQSITCAHYLQIGYTCTSLAAVTGFEQEVDCHCSCPAGAAAGGAAGGGIPAAGHCNMAFVNQACSDASVITPTHLCDNQCSQYLIGNWQVCSNDPTMNKALIQTFDQVGAVSSCCTPLFFALLSL